MQNIQFVSWESAGRTLFITFPAYVLLLFLLRASGKPSLSTMNVFDLIVTIALGSILVTVMLNKSVALLDGLLALNTAIHSLRNNKKPSWLFTSP